MVKKLAMQEFRFDASFSVKIDWASREVIIFWAWFTTSDDPT